MNVVNHCWFNGNFHFPLLGQFLTIHLGFIIPGRRSGKGGGGGGCGEHFVSQNFPHKAGAFHQTTFCRVPHCQQNPAKRRTLTRNTHFQFEFICWYTCPILSFQTCPASKVFCPSQGKTATWCNMFLKHTVFYTIPFSFPNQPLQCFIPQASPATLDPWFSICCWLKHVNPPWFDPFTLCSSTMAIENASNMEVSMAKLVKLIARGLPPQSPGLTPPAPWRCRSPVSAPSLPWPAWPPVRRPYGRRGSSTARSTWGRRRGRSPRSIARSDGWGEWLPGDRWWFGDVEKSW